MNPLISVCIPTYNGAKYFRECLDSILAQTFTGFEVLIVDDHSSDETLSIAQEYANQDARIRIAKNERNLGLVGNWNRCIELAQGEWIKFVFQDDLIAPTCLEKMLNTCDSDSAIAFCRRNFLFEEGTSAVTRRIYTDLALPEKYIPYGKNISVEDYCKATIKFFGINFVGEPTVMMIRKRAFEQYGNFNPHMIQLCDFELWTRFAVNTGIVYIPEVLATFRVHSGATTAKNHAAREYRLRLDKLILHHEFALHPAYENLRAFCTHQWRPIDLAGRVRRNAYFAWINAARARSGDSVQDSKITKDWEEVLAFYPYFQQVMQLQASEKVYYMILRRLVHWQWQLTQLYRSHFQT